MSKCSRNSLWLLIFPALIAWDADAQQADSVRRPPRTVAGYVQDSLTRTPLSDAIVQLVAADTEVKYARTVISDALGRYAFSEVPDGRYMLGFFHPLLDSIGVEPVVREVKIDGARGIRVDLSTPSQERLRAKICGDRAKQNAGFAVGFVRDAKDRTPLGGVQVTGEWLELSFRRNGVMRNVPRIVATTADNGWFAMCNIPVGGAMTFIAALGGDSTDAIEVQVPKEGFLRHELFIGRAMTDSVLAAQPVTKASRRIHYGDGRVSGVVYAYADGRPLQGAIVNIVDGPETRTDIDGKWSITDAPVGTRMLEVHAIGYYPDRRFVNVVNDAAPVRVALSTLQAVLDTVRVKANRLSTIDRSGFADRARTGIGRYVTEKDIAKRPATFASDIFKSIHGIRIGFATDTLATDLAIAVDPDIMSSTDKRILMRGIDGDWCAPAIFLDGLHMSQFSAEDLDGWLYPREIAGIEIYSEATVPNEFQKSRSGCGSIVIWRKK
ncbi:MAG TPA: carboxypeptidase-like regulatory domain-containing protein [Gemmatimonadaceae bacterium]